MSDCKRYQAAKYKMAQSINSRIPFTLQPPSLTTLEKKEVSQVGLFEDPCIKEAFKNNIKAEKLS